ncbi:unnamed protein product [Mytilus edulis]|uniref:B box-type domain-containing protein n=1 Tax=Mytilus edulis TaxID=6550 RepID=A0A8S3U0J7_MYTED|nr:unnamed protein product [Mytilus edulis]
MSRNITVEMKCMECDILICDNCDTNVHGGHETIDINDIHFTEPKPKEIKLTKLNTYATNLPFCSATCNNKNKFHVDNLFENNNSPGNANNRKLTQIRGYNDKFVLDMAAAIHVSDDNIIVSTRETGDAFPLTEHSRRQIVVLHQTGKRKMTVIEYDQHNKRLFSIIGSVQMDNMGNIYGVDCLTCNDFGRIVKVVKSRLRGSMKEIQT